jgi:cyclopropane-fatty-acyl-phospholipid synthase
MGIKAKIFGLAERGLIPDVLVRVGIRKMSQVTGAAARCATAGEREERMREWVAQMDESPIALAPVESNEQHYEVPSAFFAEVLGPHRKYSCAYWAEGTTSLAQAEAEGLERTCANAELKDGQKILELGCGWGSLSLFMAARYPKSTITAVSHSRTQRETILSLAEARGLDNIEVITCDMNDFEPPEPGSYDRVVSVEMFEHMRNYRLLLKRISTWLKPGGKLLVHVFCHKETAYPYVDSGDPNDWMTRHFFAGGMMPSDDLLTRFQDDLTLEEQWRWNGNHYGKTSEAWLELMDRRKATAYPIIAKTYGDDAKVWWGRWRIFFMACAEFFALNGGEEWYVSHYRFERPA